MRKVLFAKIDIVLSDGVFLKKGNRYEVEISEEDYDFVAPYTVDLTPQDEEPVRQEEIKQKPKRQPNKKVVEKNELD